jgi:hypothetical protein
MNSHLTSYTSTHIYMHTRTSMSTSVNCSHSRNLINSIFVVFAVVSSSNRPHNITVDLSVLSPHLPLVVWYRETDLQCCSSSLTLGWLEAHKLWLLFPSQSSLVLTNSLSSISTLVPTDEERDPRAHSGVTEAHSSQISIRLTVAIVRHSLRTCKKPVEFLST